MIPELSLDSQASVASLQRNRTRLRFRELGCGLLQMDSALMSDVHKDSRPLLDDIHSFVLRVHLDRSQLSKNQYRSRFLLEYVNERTARRFKSLDELLDHLRLQVTQIFDEFGVGDDP